MDFFRDLSEYLNKFYGSIRVGINRQMDIHQVAGSIGSIVRALLMLRSACTGKACSQYHLAKYANLSDIYAYLLSIPK